MSAKASSVDTNNQLAFLLYFRIVNKDKSDL